MRGTYVTTGRHKAGRVESPTAYCQSCRVRLTVGTPRPSEQWPRRFKLDPLSADQFDLLLVGAAEFLHLGGGDIIDFLDWVRPEALGEFTLDHPEFDGLSVQEGDARQSQPWPLPVHRGRL